MLKEDIWGSTSSSKAGASAVTATGIEGLLQGQGHRTTGRRNPEHSSSAPLQCDPNATSHSGKSSFSSNTQLCPEFVKWNEKEKGIQEGFGVHREVGCNERAPGQDSARPTSTREAFPELHPQRTACQCAIWLRKTTSTEKGWNSSDWLFLQSSFLRRPNAVSKPLGHLPDNKHAAQHACSEHGLISSLIHFITTKHRSFPFQNHGSFYHYTKALSQTKSLTDVMCSEYMKDLRITIPQNHMFARVGRDL